MQKILIINLGGIGDLILSSVAVNALKARYRDSLPDIVVVERVVGIARHLGVFGNIFVYPKGILGKIRLLLRLRRNHYGLVINMRSIAGWPGAIKIFLLIKTINAKQSAGRNTDNRGLFFDIRIPEPSIGDKYEMEYDIDTVEALGVAVADKTINLRFGNNVEKLKKLLEESGITKDDILIGIHPGGTLNRRWPVENFAELIEAVNRSIKCKFIITGDKHDNGLINKLRKACGINIISFANSLNIDELVALIKKCRVYISNDTGPMHLAAALKVPLVAIFGPGDLVRFDPRHIFKEAVVLYKKQVCAPCNKKWCNSLKCLQAVSSREVIDAVLGLLSKGKNA